MSIRGCSMLVEREDATPWVCLVVILVTMTSFFITHFYYPDIEYYPRGIFLICSACLIYPIIGRIADYRAQSLFSRLSVSSLFFFCNSQTIAGDSTTPDICGDTSVGRMGFNTTGICDSNDCGGNLVVDILFYQEIYAVSRFLKWI